MPEYSRILIEQYCMDHSKTKKAKFLCAVTKKTPLVSCNRLTKRVLIF